MIILMGIKHSGKTSLGKMIARDLYLPFQDLDTLMEELYSEDRKFNIRQIYLKLGEIGFRDLEYKAIQKTDIKGKTILSLGGGTIDNPEVMALVKKADLLVFLDAEEKTLFDRIQKNGFPSFLKKSPEKLFHNLYIRRRDLYKKIADITLKIKDESPAELLTILLKKIEEKNEWQ
jgi:shikimate kinase